MAAVCNETRKGREHRAPAAETVEALVLLRTLCARGATRAEIIKDINPLISHKLSPAAWRAMADEALAALSLAGLVAGVRGRFTPTPAGIDVARRLFGEAAALSREWSDCRDTVVVAKALGISEPATATLKPLATPQGLAAAIVQSSFGLPINPRQSLSRLRAELAVLALERAFGNKIKSGLGQSGSGLSAKAGRLLAAQLARVPRDYNSDGRLVSALAAEAVNAPGTEDTSLRAAVLRGMITRALNAPAVSLSQQASAEVTRPRAVTRPANDAGPAAQSDALSARPDLPRFASEVMTAARTCAEGWPGSRKAFISRTWSAIRVSRPEWNLSEIEFKCMLAEAHRAGKIMLANADLKDKSLIGEIEASAILYKNTVWHFVRVDD